eukprot:scaffold8775_cov129-Isochrysis_galbana.AAC.4
MTLPCAMCPRRSTGASKLPVVKSENPEKRPSPSLLLTAYSLLILLIPATGYGLLAGCLRPYKCLIDAAGDPKPLMIAKKPVSEDSGNRELWGR